MAETKTETPKPQKEAAADKEFRHFVRIANTDLPGEKQVLVALRRIKGINIMIANSLCRLSDIDITKKAGYLSDSEIAKLDSMVNDFSKANLPSWMLNRRKDPEDGTDVHLISGDLDFARDNDIKRMRKKLMICGRKKFILNQRLLRQRRACTWKVLIWMQTNSGKKSFKMD